MGDTFGFFDPSGIPNSDPDNFGKTGNHTLNINLLEQFRNHPFHVEDDEEMDVLVQSIKANGILTPILVRFTEEDCRYEILSGHRRVHACKRLGINTIPATVIVCTDEEAVCKMINSNNQRENIKPSERAKSIAMMRDLYQEQHQDDDGSSDEMYAYINAQTGISDTQIRKYLRLALLNDDLLNRLDKNEFPLQVGYELSFIDKANQDALCIALNGEKADIDLKKAKLLRQKSVGNVPPTTYEHLLERKNYARAKKAQPNKFEFTKEMLDSMPPNLPEEGRADYLYHALVAYQSSEEYRSLMAAYNLLRRSYGDQ